MLRSENLHRAELSVGERADQIAEWIRLTETRGISGQVASNLSQGESVIGRPEGGVRAAARELGIVHREARRAVTIAGIMAVPIPATIAGVSAEDITPTLNSTRSAPLTPPSALCRLGPALFG